MQVQGPDDQHRQAARHAHPHQALAPAPSRAQDLSRAQAGAAARAPAQGPAQALTLTQAQARSHTRAEPHHQPLHLKAAGHLLDHGPDNGTRINSSRAHSNHSCMQRRASLP